MGKGLRAGRASAGRAAIFGARAIHRGGADSGGRTHRAPCGEHGNLHAGWRCDPAGAQRIGPSVLRCAGMRASLQPISLDRLSRILWAATLLALPVTSFRYFPAGDATYVRPLSFYPLALLLLVLLIQLIRHETVFPWAGTWTPFAALVMATLAASMVGVLIAPVPLRGQAVIGRELRAWVTLLMGAGFFLGAAWMNRTLDDLRFSLKWLFTGF